MVLVEGLAVAIAGIALGLVGAIAASGAVERLLYEVQPHDPLTLATTTVSFLAIAAAASLLPAQRAMRVDPAQTLGRE
jgi:ABC-type lipoprotein release transport system permease subunit